MKTPKHLSFLGYMGSGKSTIGKRIAERMNRRFIDLDVLIESRTNSTIQEIFQQKGEIHFRKLEQHILHEVLDLDEALVLSLGGGTPIFYENMNQINQKSVSVYLRANPQTIANHLFTEMHQRPLISHLKNKEELKEFVAKHLFERRVFYETAQLTIDINQKSIKEIENYLLFTLLL